MTLFWIAFGVIGLAFLMFLVWLAFELGYAAAKVLGAIDAARRHIKEGGYQC